MSDFLNFIGGLGQGIFNAISQAQNRNLQLQLQKQAWEREDNAVQRRMKDLEAAGINPMMAAGQAAESSAPVSTQAPEMNIRPYSNQNRINNMMAKMAELKGQVEIARTQADIDYVKAQTQGQHLRNKNFPGMTEAEIANLESQATFRNTQNEWYSKTAEANIAATHQAAAANAAREDQTRQRTSQDAQLFAPRLSLAQSRAHEASVKARYAESMASLSRNLLVGRSSQQQLNNERTRIQNRIGQQTIDRNIYEATLRELRTLYLSNQVDMQQLDLVAKELTIDMMTYQRNTQFIGTVDDLVQIFTEVIKTFRPPINANQRR